MPRLRFPALVLTVLALASACVNPAGDTRDQKRAAVREMRTEALSQLYREVPSAKATIQGAVGYAVFSSISTKVFVVASGRGYGIARDNATGKETYMRMVELGGGVGFGLKDLRVVLAFKSKPAWKNFIENGIEIGGDAEVAAKSGEQGASVAASETVLSLVTNDVQVFQITQAGAAVAATVTAAKYYVDDELN